MPDQPGKGSPSSAPLSVEDADRLAESFTPFWEDDDVSAPAATPEPAAAGPAATSTPAGPATAAAITLPAAKRPLNKQTLLGMAPIAAAPPPAVPAQFFSTAPAPTLTATQPTAASTATTAAPGPSNPHKRTLLGFSVPEPQAASTDPVATPIIQSAANVPGYAIAYTPKDGPATPPVVIAPEAQSSPEAVKRPLSETQPSKVRALPTATAPSPLALAMPDDPADVYYPPKTKTGMLVAAGIGGVLVLLGIAIGIRAMTRSTASDGAAAIPGAALPAAPVATTAVVTPVPAAAAVGQAPAAAVVATPTAEPTRAPTESSAPAAAAPERVRQAPAEQHVNVGKPKSEPVAAPAPRPTPRPLATAAFPSEPSTPAPKSTAGKSVIVRDAPF